MGAWQNFRDRVNKIRVAAFGSMNDSGDTVNVVPGLGQINVANTNINPTEANVPQSWARAFMGPGLPWTSDMGGQNIREDDKDKEPRSFQYTTAVNTMISPRIPYGLMSFYDLRRYAENTPEVTMCIRLLTEEIKAFIPTIVNEKDESLQDDENPYLWMITSPDRYNPWPVWLSRFLYNVLVYDAGCSYRLKDDDKDRIIGTRVIDGSTIFVLIDESGEQPEPPAPAYTQIIWGTPLAFMNRKQLWYKPRHLRADAPYGRSPIEDAFAAVVLLDNLWQYEAEKYVEGNMPEMLVTAPPNWKSADEILEFEAAFNARMVGNTKERAGRIRFLPSGVESVQTKELTFNESTHAVATNTIRMAYGIPQSEVGETPTGGLGGQGYAEAMQSAFYRMGLAPLITYIEGHFNDVIKENGDEGKFKFKLQFPADTLDPAKEEDKYIARFEAGVITRDETRQGLKMKPLGGNLGEVIVDPNGGGGQDEGDGEDGGDNADGMDKPVKVAQSPHSVRVLRNAIRVLRKPIPVKKMDAFMNPAIPLDDLKKSKATVEDLAESIGYEGDMDQFRAGYIEEHEHAETVGGDDEMMARIVMDHLAEDPEYYDKLKDAMKIMPMHELRKYSGVDPSDDEYYAVNPIIADDVEMPSQGANDANVIAIGDDDHISRAAVWKPEDGEEPVLQDSVGGLMFPRAEAVYLVDRALAPTEDDYLVPVTYTAEIDGIRGSIQHYVQDWKPRKNPGEYSARYIEQAAVLDYITGQLDRKNHNFLTHPDFDDRPILIDNDLSFPVEKVKFGSGFITAFGSTEISSSMLDSIYLVIGNESLWQDLYEVMDNDVAVDKARERAQELYDTKHIPGAGMIEVIKPSTTSTDVSKADFVEDQHPRDNNGEFAPKGGGGGGGDKENGKDGKKVTPKNQGFQRNPKRSLKDQINPGPHDKFSAFHGEGLKGDNGNKLVAYQHIRTEGEKYSGREEGMVGAKVSDFDRAIPCSHCGRPVVHAFYVQDKDGNVMPYGSEHLHTAMGWDDPVNATKQKKIISELDYQQQLYDERKKELSGRGRDSKGDANLVFTSALGPNAHQYIPGSYFMQNEDGKYIRFNPASAHPNDSQILSELGYKKVSMDKADFVEDQHPRESDGKFAPKGGGGGGESSAGDTPSPFDGGQDEAKNPAQAKPTWQDQGRKNSFIMKHPDYDKNKSYAEISPSGDKFSVYFGDGDYGGTIWDFNSMDDAKDAGERYINNYQYIKPKLMPDKDSMKSKSGNDWNVNNAGWSAAYTPDEKSGQSGWIGMNPLTTKYDIKIYDTEKSHRPIETSNANTYAEAMEMVEHIVDKNIADKARDKRIVGMTTYKPRPGRSNGHEISDKVTKLREKHGVGDASIKEMEEVSGQIKALGKDYDNLFFGDKNDEVEGKLKEISDQRRALANHYVELKDKYDAGMKVVKEAIYSEIRPDPKDKVNMKVSENGGEFDKSWVEGNKAVEFVSGILHKDVMSGNISGDELEINCNRNRFINRAHYDPSEGVVVNPKDHAFAIVHEMGHALEHSSFSAKAAAIEFLYLRTYGQKSESLNLVKNTTCYADDEVTKKDGFPDPYCGKIYDNNDTEILSMGFQYMYDDPVKFHQADPEYFAFMVDIMKGNYGK